MVDQRVQTLDIVQHVTHEALLLFGADTTPFEGLQIQLQGGERRFQLMRDTVDEIGLPSVQVDGLDRQPQVEYDADQHENQKGCPDRQQGPVERRPAMIGDRPEG